MFLMPVLVLPFGVEIWQTSKIYLMSGVSFLSIVAILCHMVSTPHKMRVQYSMAALGFGSLLFFGFVSFVFAGNWYRDLVGVFGSGFHHSLILLLALVMLYKSVLMSVSKKEVGVLMFWWMVGVFVSNIVFLVAFFRPELVQSVGEYWGLQLAFWRGVNLTSASFYSFGMVQLSVLVYAIANLWNVNNRMPKVYKFELLVFLVQAFGVFLLIFEIEHLVVFLLVMVFLCISIVRQKWSEQSHHSSLSFIPKIFFVHRQNRWMTIIVPAILVLGILGVMVSGYHGSDDRIEMKASPELSWQIVSKTYQNNPLKAITGFGPSSVRKIWLENQTLTRDLDQVFVKSNDVLFSEIFNLAIRYGVLGVLMYVVIWLWIVRVWWTTMVDKNEKRTSFLQPFVLTTLSVWTSGFLVSFDVVLWFLAVVTLGMLEILHNELYQKDGQLTGWYLDIEGKLAKKLLGAGLIIYILIFGAFVWGGINFYRANLLFAQSLHEDNDVSQKIVYTKKAHELNPYEELYYANYLQYRGQEVALKLAELQNNQDIQKTEEAVELIKTFTKELNDFDMTTQGVEVLRSKWDGYAMLLGYVDVEYGIFEDMLKIVVNMSEFENEFKTKMAIVQTKYANKVASQSEKERFLTQASTNLLEVLKANDEDKKSVLAYVEVLKLQSKTSEACQVLEGYIDDKTKKNQVVDVGIMVSLATVYIEEERLSDAKLALEKILKVFSLNSDALYLYAQILEKENNPLEAKKYYEQVLQLNPNNATITQKLESLK
jgi:tetratricopeptide (TPR) repeat protein